MLTVRCKLTFSLIKNLNNEILEIISFLSYKETYYDSMSGKLNKLGKE